MKNNTLHLTEHAADVLGRRFLLRDEHGELAEDAPALFERVARSIAAVDERYGERPEASAERFLGMMTCGDFLPNSPTLMNAGTVRGQLSGCFVLPIDDSMESIYGTLRDAALIQKTGGGTGFSFSGLRPRGAYIKSTRGQSSGPVSFMKLYDHSTMINRLGGTRAGANMAVLRCDHPDVMEFVDCKADLSSLTSFNISVMATDEFMGAVESGGAFRLHFAGISEHEGQVDAAGVFEAIVKRAWDTGDPGLLFYDTMNAANPTPALGSIEATNPCGEQPLLDHESCNLGSINVARFVRGDAVDYDRLAEVVGVAIHFLDNVIDANDYPVAAIREVTTGNRKVGLGIMGFADLLVRLGLPYASEEAVTLAEELMSRVQQFAKHASRELAAQRGPFPNFARSRYAEQGEPDIRNACVTSIAPTGTIGLLADCSSGIEPFFALSYRREVIGHEKVIDVHPVLAEMLQQHTRGDELLRQVRSAGRLPVEGTPPQLRELFATAYEIDPEWHVRMQAAFQAHTDTGVSKTVNLPEQATTKDVARAYRRAFETGCKGITIFRDGSKPTQVLRAGDGAQPTSTCPECGEELALQSGCTTCLSCGYSICSI